MLDRAYLAAHVERPLQVHLTGGGSQTSEILTPVAIVLAALVGAWFAARYARRNVAQELAAADRRLAAQMSHDRELRDRQTTRETLDQVVETMTRALNTGADFAAAIATAEHIRREAEDEKAEEAQREDARGRLSKFEGKNVGPLRKDSVEAFLQTHPAKLRLRLRYPAGHPILSAYDKWQSAIDSSHDLTEKGVGRLRSKEELAESKASKSQIPAALASFVRAVHTWNDETPADSV